MKVTAHRSTSGYHIDLPDGAYLDLHKVAGSESIFQPRIAGFQIGMGLNAGQLKELASMLLSVAIDVETASEQDITPVEEEITAEELAKEGVQVARLSRPPLRLVAGVPTVDELREEYGPTTKDAPNINWDDDGAQLHPL